MAKKKKQQQKKKITETTSAKTTVAAQQHVPMVDSPSTSPHWLYSKWIKYFIFSIAFLAYANTLGLDFAIDDEIVIRKNAYTKKGLKGLNGIWTEDTFMGFFQRKQQLVAGGRYRPLSVATFAVENQLFGKVAKVNGEEKLDKDRDINYLYNPFIGHLGNALLFALLSLLIYQLILELFNPSRQIQNSVSYLTAFITALLFATHPIHTEVVANIKGRDEILAALGSIGALYYTLKATNAQEGKGFAYQLLASLLFLVGIFSKEYGITFLAIIPAALYIFTKKSPKYIALQTLPYLGISLLFLIVRAKVLNLSGIGIGGDSAPVTELMNNPFLKYEEGKYIAFTTSEKLATLFYTWIYYFKLLVLPHPLTHDYYPCFVRGADMAIPSFGDPVVLLSLLLHLALGALTVKGLFERKAYAFFLLFYFASFSVVSNLVFPIGTNMAERFLFIPSFAFCALVAMGLSQVLKVGQNALSSTLQKGILISGLIALAFAAKTVSRNTVWYNDLVIFQNDIQYSPNSAKLNNALSGILQDSCKNRSAAIRQEWLERAKVHSLRAVELHPTYIGAWILNGNASIYLGENAMNKIEIPGMESSKATLTQEADKHFNDALKAYQQALKINNKHQDLPRNLAVLYRHMGRLKGQYQGDVNNSIKYLEQSIKYQPKDWETYRLLGLAYGIRGQQTGSTVDNQKAMQNFEAGCNINPNSPNMLFNLQMAYQKLGMMPKAWKAYDQRIKIDPTFKANIKPPVPR